MQATGLIKNLHHIFPDNTRALWFELSQTYKSGSTERSGSRVELSFANGKIYGQRNVETL